MLSRFFSEIRIKWLKVQRNHNRFLSCNVKWLDSEIQIFTEIPALTSKEPARGRPPKAFNESSQRTKRRKTTGLRHNVHSELQYATQMNLRAAGKVDAARVVKDIAISPTRGNKFRRGFKKRDFSIPKLPSEEAPKSQK